MYTVAIETKEQESICLISEMCVSSLCVCVCVRAMAVQWRGGGCGSPGSAGARGSGSALVVLAALLYRGEKHSKHPLSLSVTAADEYYVITVQFCRPDRSLKILRPLDLLLLHLLHLS